MDTRNNTILITGGSSGIGLSLAKRFLLLGNKVIIVGRDQEKLEQVRRDFPEIYIHRCDLAEKESLENLATMIMLKYPELNILINNAALQYNYSFLDEEKLLQKIDYEIATNITAPIKLTALLLPTIKKNENSAIVNVSSGLFIAPKKSAAVYCASKSAIHIFSKTLRYQLENTNTKVFEIIPALIDTPMTEGRGKSKITAEQLVNEFISNFEKDRFEIYIGKTKILKLINRISPKLADKIMKNGL